MKRKGHFIWIDDTPTREQAAVNLAKELKVDVTFHCVKNKEVATVVAAVLKGKQPDLLIVDHILDKTTDVSRVLERGSTIAEAVKAKWPRCPVVGVTAANIATEIDLRTREAYDELVSFTHFDTYMEPLGTIANDFAEVGRRKKLTGPSLIQLLRPPKSDAGRLESILPDQLKADPEDASLPSRIYAWVQRVLVERPGFLYDELWSATLIGITPAAFDRLSKQFGGCRYVGAFSLPHRQRWWKAALTDLVYKAVPPDPREQTWHVGRRLRGVEKKDFSKCSVCGLDFPEVVAFEDATVDGKRHQMHLRCTVAHPRFSRELFFEEIRMMEGAK